MPPEYLAMFLDEDERLPVPDAVMGLEEEGAGESAPAPPLDELLQDPDVAAVVEAADGLVPAT